MRGRGGARSVAGMLAVLRRRLPAQGATEQSRATSGTKQWQLWLQVQSLDSRLVSSRLVELS